jgi:hypothetical protein
MRPVFTAEIYTISQPHCGPAIVPFINAKQMAVKRPSSEEPETTILMPLCLGTPASCHKPTQFQCFFAQKMEAAGVSEVLVITP